MSWPAALKRSPLSGTEIRRGVKGDGRPIGMSSKHDGMQQKIHGVSARFLKFEAYHIITLYYPIFY